MYYFKTLAPSSFCILLVHDVPNGVRLRGSPLKLDISRDF